MPTLSRLTLTIALLLPLALPSMGQTSPATAVQPSAAFTLTTAPARLVNGMPFIARVHTHSALKSLNGVFFKSAFAFEYDRQAGIWWALAAVPYDLRSGKYTLKLESVDMDGRQESAELPLVVFPGNYPVSRIRVPPKFIKPPAEVQERIKAEREIKSKVFGEPPTPIRYWTLPFEKPVDNITTSPYGASRVYNGVRGGVHTGLDFRALEATPVRAVAGGKVILARDLYYEGGFVLLDHGQGLMSMYMHLSAFDVKEGDAVERGQIIARSGGTGQSTGPHLHLGIRWNKLLVDPSVLLTLEMPK